MLFVTKAFVSRDCHSYYAAFVVKKNAPPPIKKEKREMKKNKTLANIKIQNMDLGTQLNLAAHFTPFWVFCIILQTL